MRILMLTDDVVIDRRILQEAETLIDLGHEVILLAAGAESLPEFELVGRVKVERVRHCLLPPSSERLVSNGPVGTGKPLPFPVSKLKVLNRRLKRMAARGMKGLDLLVEAVMWGPVCRSVLSCLELSIVWRIQQFYPDVIHAHDLPRLKVAVYAKRRFGLPVVYDAHELYPEINSLSRFQRWLQGRLEKRLVPYCDHAITVNPFIAKEMAKRYKIREPTVIYNAVNRPDGFDPTVAPNRFRETMPIPDGDAVLLYQGWMSQTRGLQDLVRAMSLVDDGVHLVMMGYGDARADLEQIVRERGLGGRVHFKEAVSQAELLYWTASADAGIIPYQPVDLNNYYCSPNKLFEFIQAALPIIVNDLPFLRKVVGQEEFGVVAKLEREEQYVQAIREMFDESKGGPGRFRQRLLGRATDYNWSREEEKLLSVYGQLQRS